VTKYKSVRFDELPPVAALAETLVDVRNTTTTHLFETTLSAFVPLWRLPLF
jgi:hypothetical protein